MDRRTFLLTAGVTIGSLGAAGCIGAPSDGGASPTDTTTPTDSPTPTEGQSPSGDGPTVDMVTEGSEFYFDPIGLHVPPGTTVVWRLENDVHSSTAYVEGVGGAEVTRIPDGAEGWDSGILQSAGETFEYPLEVEGTYDYFCTPHKTAGMVARLIVGEPGGPAEGSMPPDGAVPDSQTIVERGEIPYAEFSE